MFSMKFWDVFPTVLDSPTDLQVTLVSPATEQVKSFLARGMYLGLVPVGYRDPWIGSIPSRK